MSNEDQSREIEALKAIVQVLLTAYEADFRTRSALPLAIALDEMLLRLADKRPEAVARARQILASTFDQLRGQ